MHLKRETKIASKVADDYINFIAEQTVPMAVTQEEVERETLVDETLHEVVKCNQNVNWDNSCNFPLMPLYCILLSELSA